MFSLPGCVMMIMPYEQQVTPVYYGQIIDRETGMPVADVDVEVVVLHPDPGIRMKHRTSAQSDKDGNYAVVVTASMSVADSVLGTVTGLYCGGHVTFNHPGHETFSYETREPKGREARGGVCAGERFHKDVSLVRTASN